MASYSDAIPDGYSVAATCDLDLSFILEDGTCLWHVFLVPDDEAHMMFGGDSTFTWAAWPFTSSLWHPIGCACAPTVQEDHPAEGSEARNEVGVYRVIPKDLDIAPETYAREYIRTASYDLVRDIGIPDGHVSRLGWLRNLPSLAPLSTLRPSQFALPRVTAPWPGRRRGYSGGYKREQ